MFTRSEIKDMAKDQIKGNIGMLFLCSLICAVIIAVTTPLFIGVIISPALYLGLTSIYLGLTNGIAPELNGLFSRMSIFGRAFLLNLMIGLFTMLWSLLFFIPGIIKGLSYSMATYVLAENPEMSASEALDESKRITDGHKMDLFILALSFFPWILLTGVTFGIAGIYVGPYISSTMANAYNKLKLN